MSNTITINNQYFIKIKFILLIFFIILIGIIFYAHLDLSEQDDVNTSTDIDWTKPPCKPDDLSNNWKEITNVNMKNRRVFTYKNTNIKIAFDKAVAGAPRFRGTDHWHRFNPNMTNKQNFYLDMFGHPTAKNSNQSHIKPNCK